MPENKRRGVTPSLMLATPGCWAWDEIGALLAGVFWGVLHKVTLAFCVSEPGPVSNPRSSG